MTRFTGSWEALASSTTEGDQGLAVLDADAAWGVFHGLLSFFLFVLSAGCGLPDWSFLSEFVRAYRVRCCFRRRRRASDIASVLLAGCEVSRPLRAKPPLMEVIEHILGWGPQIHQTNGRQATVANFRPRWSISQNGHTLVSSGAKSLNSF